MKSQSKKVQLVLGCGGARGMAHIGVIEALEKEGFIISEVIGCSMGAVVGGLYCAGHLETYKQWLLGLSSASVRDLFDFTLTRCGFVKGDKIFEKIIELTGEQFIGDFEIPFTAVATDLVTMKEVHHKSGNLYQALRASVSMPGLFVPVAAEDTLLVDGRVINPLPVNLVKRDKDAIVIAVNVNGKPSRKNGHNDNTHGFFLTSLLKKIVPFISAEMNGVPDFTLFQVLSRSYYHMLDRLTQLMIEAHKPDIVVEIPWDACDTFEFYKAAEIIDLGKEAYERAKRKYHARARINGYVNHLELSSANGRI